MPALQLHVFPYPCLACTVTFYQVDSCIVAAAIGLVRDGLRVDPLVYRINIISFRFIGTFWIYQPKCHQI